MNVDQLREWQYYVSERLGMMCEDRKPTPEQTAEAQRLATIYVEGCLK